jgi:hypothetical protein
LVTAGLALACGVIAAVSAFSAWWTWSVTATGYGTVAVHFLPGNTLSGRVFGTAATNEYAGAGLGQTGALYEGVLAGAMAVMVLCFIAGIVTLLAALGKVRNPARHSTLRNTLVVPLYILLVLVVIVPVLQPSLIDRDSPGLCSDLGTKATPCNSFWGSVHPSGGSSEWGADVGWYLAVSAVVLLIAAIVVWWWSADEAWGGPASTAAIGIPRAAPGPGGTASGSPLDQIVKLRELTEGGFMTQSEFEDVKSRLIAAVATSQETPEEELRKLKTMYEAGTISPSEYDTLRKTVLGKF